MYKRADVATLEPPLDTAAAAGAGRTTRLQRADSFDWARFEVIGLPGHDSAFLSFIARFGATAQPVVVG